MKVETNLNVWIVINQRIEIACNVISDMGQYT